MVLTALEYTYKGTKGTPKATETIENVENHVFLENQRFYCADLRCNSSINIQKIIIAKQTMENQTKPLELVLQIIKQKH